MISRDSNANQAAAGTRYAVTPPQRRRSRYVMVLAALAGAACLGGVPNPAAAIPVTLDTSSRFGVSAQLEFSLLDGDLLGNNSATIGSISTDGTLGVSDCSVGCAGGPPYMINEAFGFGQFLQNVILGNRLSFDLTFTSNFAGGTPDRLSLVLLDPDTSFPLITTDPVAFPGGPVPVEHALLIVDFTPGAVIQVATLTDPALPVAVPEPGGAALFSLGLALLGGQRIRRGASRVSSDAEAAELSRRAVATPIRPGE